MKRNAEEWDAFINYVRRFYKSQKRSQTSGTQCRLVAIRTMPRLSKLIGKVVKPNQFFQIYSQYQFNDDGTISYLPDQDLRIYDIDDTRIDIAAIVGKNGSGKSALTEMLILAINNMSSRLSNLKTDYKLKYQPGLHLQIFFHTDTLYRINSSGNKINITEYDFHGSTFSESKNHRLTAFDLSELFYTIYINYSSYSLNSKDSNNWLDPLFKKNDSYQVPIVLSPYRDQGNFNINKENHLVKSRLLSNLLEPVDQREPENFRKLTENGKYATHLIFSYRKDEEEPESTTTSLQPEEEFSDEYLLDEAMNYFRFSGKGFNAKTKLLGMKYIAGKFRRIARNYPLTYGAYTNPESGVLIRRRLNGFFREIKRDRSHVTYKLRQAINFFKYKLYQRTKLNTGTSIEELSKKIETLKSTFIRLEKLRTIELIPPPFFNTEILLENDQSFQFLSSGEKQQIFSVSSVVYHLNNLDSVVDGKNLITYRNVTVLFDELELYYHPDMQRSFIDFLLRYLKRANFENIQSIQLCFVTHSPFILSDIFNSNTLYLNEGKAVPNAMNGNLTFAGNIHDLLANSFFLTHGLMGVFAKRQIRSAMQFLMKDTETKATRNQQNTADEEKEEDDEVKEILNIIDWDQNTILNFINRIGEPLLRESLMQLYAAKYIRTQDELEREIEKIKKIYNQRTA